jgi:hypothetical protein
MFESRRWCPTRSLCWDCDRMKCAAGGKVDSRWQEDNDIQCSNCTGLFPWFSIQHSARSLEVSESVRTVSAQRTEGSRKNEPCKIYHGIQMKEKMCLTGLFLGTNHRCITTNPNQSVLHCGGNIPVLLQPRSLKLRIWHQPGRLCLPCFEFLEEYC